ncbi:MAG: polyprenyl synthetase family protein [Candidatus Omnitrophica bacterium]|nr:polyprenyl synthetase family protein [Candidatus Omnitrophota bacterium]
MDIEKYIVDKKNIIDKTLDKYLPKSSLKPQVIHRAMRYSVFPGGKRIRPIFTIAGFEACGGKGDSAMPVACGIELIHSYTLIHDDLPCMDNDDFRRGKQACHKKFGEDIALLAGDGLLTLAFQVIAESGNIDIIKEISKAIGTCGVIGGQVADIMAQSSRFKVQRKHIEYINLNKTAVLFEVAAKSGGIIKDASKKEINALGNFGRNIGVTFQLLDDLKDKDGYVNLYGEKRTKEKAEKLASAAKNHLKIFGKKANRLLELANLICA